MAAQIISFKVIFFSLHNKLTHSDYTYSVDDFCDLMLFFGAAT